MADVFNKFNLNIIINNKHMHISSSNVLRIDNNWRSKFKARFHILRLVNSTTTFVIINRIMFHKWWCTIGLFMSYQNINSFMNDYNDSKCHLIRKLIMFTIKTREFSIPHFFCSYKKIKKMKLLDFEKTGKFDVLCVSFWRSSRNNRSL